MAITYTISAIAEITGGKLMAESAQAGKVIEHLLTDSRKLVYAPSTLFFALPGLRRNGEDYIEELYDRGVRNFVVAETSQVTRTDASYIMVSHPLEALQRLAAFHRQQFDIPVIAIAGSNGKTIVKEWLYQLLQKGFNIVRSPKSYNSQVGVPLSVWQMNETHNLAIFEAGISRHGEMKKLQQVIRPTIGIFTHLGEAHSENFSNREEKAAEKIKLFAGASWVIANGDDEIVRTAFSKEKLPAVFYGTSANDAIRILSVEKRTADTRLQLVVTDNQKASLKSEGAIELLIPFTDDASVENCITCLCVLIKLGYTPPVIAERMQTLQQVSMRLEMKQGINNCTVINDSYVADPDSLRIALDFLQQVQQHPRRTVILSDLAETGRAEAELYPAIAALLTQKQIHRVIGVGPHISRYRRVLEAACEKADFFPTTEELIHHIHNLRFSNEAILIKGARSFGFERVSSLLEQKTHQTVLEVNLSAISHNIKQFQQLLRPQTKVMAMVKAFSYGSGSFEIANILQLSKVDYLAVAYTDEGVELRKAGIHLPIMVMNPEENSFAAMTEHYLEPEIFSFNMLYSLLSFLQKEGLQHYPVHIKVDTGMHRLGFELPEMEKLGQLLTESSVFNVQSVFSHLAGSEEEDLDYFTQQQADLFVTACNILQDRLSYPFLRHLSNSAAILRHPSLQFDMVRLGIGMYGINSTGVKNIELKEAAVLKTTIAQIKKIPAGDTVGYSRQGQLHRESAIATIRIGYADGYRRAFGNGVGRVLIKGYPAPVTGNIAMDMTMVDITGIADVSENDEVIIFGEGLSVEQLAQWAGTIPYEIMTGISQRVQRVYYEE
ncbi:MAG: bifunctional UDP-N-acetylmuramoyl-tripeptide:D-alanyl-D-alanine ligase/alanine racemase [Chitinophagaceae bacterium]|nr:bifunctional UDP-N-acetylmuramoyl-tripeptide:D-alanyl-D-alanine ligase/alanine racemase [Chitinophagaceae bacterium]MCW5929359.1 bifunctional UDP-N-acetylmuramoyl-tripeptide:D-alanyl-D-alanine ligase/alanine racemase [Chitinophagaceae bacterium]